jgi:hypothetical protein
MGVVNEDGGETKSKCDGHTAKACFLSIVSYQPQAFGFVFDDVGSDGWMM